MSDRIFYMRFTGGNEQIATVKARINEINEQKFKVKLPKQPEKIDDIADWIEWKGRHVGLTRGRVYGPIDDGWIYRMKIIHIMYWAMSKNSDVFVDLLEWQEEGQHGPRSCLPGVTAVHIEARKDLIGWVLGEYAEHLAREARKTERGPAR